MAEIWVAILKKSVQGKQFGEQSHKEKKKDGSFVFIFGCLLSKFVKVEGAPPKCQVASSLALFVHLQRNLVLFTEGRQRTQQYQRPKVGP